MQMVWEQDLRFDVERIFLFAFDYRLAQDLPGVICIQKT
jgi:hypothetical protein